MRHWARIPPLPRVGSNIIAALTDLLMCLWRHDTSGRTRARARLQAGDARPRNDHGRSRLGLRAQRKPDGQEKTKANHFNGTAHSLPPIELLITWSRSPIGELQSLDGRPA